MNKFRWKLRSRFLLRIPKALQTRRAMPEKNKRFLFGQMAQLNQMPWRKILLSPPPVSSVSKVRHAKTMFVSLLVSSIVMGSIVEKMGAEAYVVSVPPQKPASRVIAYLSVPIVRTIVSVRKAFSAPLTPWGY